VVVVCLSGTDINEDGGEVLRASMADADRLVILQEQALKRVPAEFHAKTRVIVQGVTPRVGPVVKDHDERFVVCVVGHLRDVKDPLRAAYASRLLEEDSRIEVRQAGSILEENYVELVKEEQEINPRYRWLGELSSEEVRRLIVESDLMVISSRSEGGPRVVGEAVVEGTPVLSSRIDGVSGLLGESYPGYFPVGDTEALAELLAKVESDASFREDLRLGIEKVAPLFDPRREKEAWETMLRELGVS
jgi:glycosyltransferase involved in cell wall biosynthesis